LKINENTLFQSQVEQQTQNAKLAAQKTIGGNKGRLSLKM
jgi:hypothetical protein